MLTALDKRLLKEVADLHRDPPGAYNIRKDGQGIDRHSLPGVEINPKEGEPGIDVLVEPGKEGTVHIPVLLTESDQSDLVYNTIDIGAEADILLVAGCGIHNPGGGTAQHDGLHTITVRKGARLRYVEKHFGEGEGEGERILNPKTEIMVEEGAYVELELVQIRGVDHTVRSTMAQIKPTGQLVMFERMLTDGEQSAESDIEVKLYGDECVARAVSRSVAQDRSRQIFRPRLIAYGRGRGRVECDSIIMGEASIRSIPEIAAEHAEAELAHEAAIGKIAGDQMMKLMALGLTSEEAEEKIISGFLS